jgi:hypothetical protein
MTARETGAVELPDWLNAEVCIENAEIAYDDSLCDEDGPVDTVISAGDLGVLIGLAKHALKSRPQPTPAGEIVERVAAAIQPKLFELYPGGGSLAHEQARNAARAALSVLQPLIEQQAATIAELREVLEMTTRALEIVNETMAEQGFGQSQNSVAVALMGRATLERTRGQ